MSRLVETVFPTRMGRDFRWLVGSSWVSNIGDGIALAAGPLLVATQTRNPMLVALAAVLERAPHLLFGLYAGALADRVDRRVMTVIANGLRALVVAFLCVVIATGHVNIAMVYAAMFLAGTGEVFADSASRTLLPMFVAKDDLGTGNARLQFGYLTANQLVGPPIGAFLFAAGQAVPFVVQAVCSALGVLLIWQIRASATRPPARPESHLRRDIAEGVRWLMNHPPLRTLALVIFTFNITWGAAWSVLVLWALDRLHIGSVGYGLLTTMAAVGGVIGTLSYGWLEERISLSTIMRVCLLMEVLTHLALAVTTIPWIAMVIMVIFGAYAFVWGTLSQTVRQRAVPNEFQGRVGSVYVMSIFVGLLIGQGLGGAIAHTWGLAAPFWFAFVGSGLTLALVWKQLGHIATTSEPQSA